MTEEKLRLIRQGIIVFLSAVIITCGSIIWMYYTPGTEISLTRAEKPNWETTLYIDGDVNLPGYYPCRYEDTISSLVEAAGGVSENKSIGKPILTLKFPSDTENYQKIDINRAPSWLLQSLPGIGEIIAGRIIDFRNENGHFSSIYELKQVEGIGTSSFAKIEQYITVSD